MSVTTSTNTVTGGVLQILTDYDLHHSGNPTTPGRPASPNEAHTDVASHNNPEGWPTDHRRVPAYRPANRNLDRSLRPDGVNPIEMTFIFTMLRGVQLSANVNYIWRKTGGHINPNIFRYKIGGEK